MEELQAVNGNLPAFDYSNVDTETANYLQDRISDMNKHVQKARYEIACELAKAHDRLAKKGYGCFYEWCEKEVGFDSNAVKKELRFYNLIGSNLPKQSYIESLPKSLQDAVARPSAPAELTQKVLDGEITTHKQWQEEKEALQKRVEKAEAEAEQAKQENETLTEQYNKQAQELQDLKDNPTVEKVVPDYYEELKSDFKSITKANDNLLRDVKSYKRENDNLRRQLAEKQAHEAGMSLQELAEEDEAFAEYLKTKRQEAKDAKIFYEAIQNLSRLPNELPEIKELCRCYMAHEATEANRAFTMKSMAQEVRLNIRKLEAALEVFEQRKIGVVK